MLGNPKRHLAWKHRTVRKKRAFIYLPTKKKTCGLKRGTNKRLQTRFTFVPFQPSQIVQSDSEVWSSAQSRPRRCGIVQSSPVWLRTEQVVCDSRHELTSKDLQRGSKGDAGRQNGKREGETEQVQKGIKKKECRERRED